MSVWDTIIGPRTVRLALSMRSAEIALLQRTREENPHRLAQLVGGVDDRRLGSRPALASKGWPNRNIEVQQDNVAESTFQRGSHARLSDVLGSANDFSSDLRPVYTRIHFLVNEPCHDHIVASYHVQSMRLFDALLRIIWRPDDAFDCVLQNDVCELVARE